MKTLQAEVEERIHDAPIHYLEDEAIFDLLNAPIMQIGFLEKQLSQLFVIH